MCIDFCLKFIFFFFVNFLGLGVGNLELFVSSGEGERGVRDGDSGIDLFSFVCDLRNVGIGDWRDDLGFNIVNFGVGDFMWYDLGDLDWLVGLFDKILLIFFLEFINCWSFGFFVDWNCVFVFKLLVDFKLLSVFFRFLKGFLFLVDFSGEFKFFFLLFKELFIFLLMDFGSEVLWLVNFGNLFCCFFFFGLLFLLTV